VTEPVSWILVEPGWRVETSDGKAVGTVHEVHADEEKDIFDGLAVSPGRLKRRRYVPAESIREITDGCIFLTIPADAFERLDEPAQQ
jgi:sporulation protein YlmC with PRC-barrel domain